MARVTRREFMRFSGTVVAGASLATMLDARQAPAQIRGTTLRMLKWSHFVPAYDQWFDKFAQEWGEKNGVRVLVDHIPHLELPARYAAEFAAGAGPHPLYLLGPSLPRPYHPHPPDMHHLAGPVPQKHGGGGAAARGAGR